MVITTALWWSYLEAGLSLITVCMSLFNKRSMNSIVASMCSKMSLKSLRSQAFENSKPGDFGKNSDKEPYRISDMNRSSISHARMVPDYGTKLETYAMGVSAWSTITRPKMRIVSKRNTHKRIIWHNASDRGFWLPLRYFVEALLCNETKKKAWIKKILH